MSTRATLRSRISSAVASRSPTPSPRGSMDLSRDNGVAQDVSRDKYRLLVTAGPSYDTSTHKIVHVNGDTPLSIENEFIRAKLKVRIRGFRGLPSSCPATSPYFSNPMHERDQYSIAFSFIPKQDLPSLDTIWGNDFDHPVRDRLPPGFNTAFRIVKEFIDPGLECDAYADEPWLYGPSVGCWFGLRIGEKVGEDAEIPEKIEEEDVLKEGGDGDGQAIREAMGIPDNNEKRRRFFINAANRSRFKFEKGRMYSVDFFNPYLDFGNFALKLPGFSIRVIKYIDNKSHTLRYVFKNRKTEEVYLCINLNLLWGEQLEKFMDGDEEVLASLAGAEVNEDGIEEENEICETNGVADKANSTAITGESKEPSQTDAFDSQAPGMKDKPDSLQEEVKNMSISNTLEETASRDRRGRKLFDDLD